MFVHLNISASEKDSFRIIENNLRRNIKDSDSWSMRCHAWGNDAQGPLYNLDVLIPSTNLEGITKVMTQLPTNCQQPDRLSYKCNTKKLYQSLDEVALPKRKTYNTEE
jgi:hypothetical protein